MERQNPYLTVVHTITRPDESTENWKGKVGRIDEDLVREYVKDPVKAIFYVCGTQSMVEDLTSLVRSMKVDTSHIKVDAFHGYD